MSIPSPEPDQPSPREDPPGQRPSARTSKPDLGKLAMGAALVSSTLAALIVGIIIGNAVRKRIDRLAHPHA